MNWLTSRTKWAWTLRTQNATRSCRNGRHCFGELLLERGAASGAHASLEVNSLI